MREWVVLYIALLTGCASAPQPLPIFDGHADFAIHYAYGDQPWAIARHDLHSLPGQGDIQRWRAGGVGAMLVTIGSGQPPGPPTHMPAVRKSLDWFDALGRNYREDDVLSRTPADVRQAFESGRIAMVVALEGAEQLDGEIANLLEAHRRGLRSLLLIYDHGNQFGDGAQAFTSSSRIAHHGGLTAEGRRWIHEANRLGILVDMSHASAKAASDALATSSAPVIFSHSGARALADTPRNLPDELLRRVGKNGGIVLIPLVPYLTTHAHWRWYDAGEREYARLVVQYGKDGAKVDEGMAAWDKANPEPRVNVADVADQIEHVARIAGQDHVGIGSDFDGMGRFVIPDLADSSRLPLLFDELRRRGWSQKRLDNLASGNFLRVWQRVLDASES